MPHTILIGDDSPANRRFLARALDGAGYGVVEALDGAEALDAALRDRPDLVLLATALPGKDGLRVCQELKNDSRTVGTPVIVMSAEESVAARIRGLEAGADDYLTLPFDVSEVMARVRCQLRLGQLTRHLVEVSEKLARRQRRLDRDIAAAASIRSSLLPRCPPVLPNLRAAWRFRPRPLAGGDLFNLMRLDERTVAAWMVDVDGHGVPAAMVTVSLAQTLEPRSGVTKRVFLRDGRGAYELASPADVLRQLALEYPQQRFGHRVRLCYLMIDTASGVARWANAGHAPPVRVRADGAAARLDGCGPPLGEPAGGGYPEARCRLAPGDRIYLHNGGLQATPDAGGEPLGEARLLAALGARPGVSLDATCAGALEAALAHAGTPSPPHDLALIGVEYAPAAAAT